MISDLKEFEKLLKLCRKQGVTDLTVGCVTVKLGELPEKQRKENEDEDAEIPTGEPSIEELMNWNNK